MKNFARQRAALAHINRSECSRRTPLCRSLLLGAVLLAYSVPVQGQQSPRAAGERPQTRPAASQLRQETVERLPPVMDLAGPWWDEPARSQMRTASSPVPISLEALVLRSLQHSAQIRVFSDLPLIRQTAVAEAEAAFDWSAFLESKWDQISEPVGNVLTVGPGSSRLRNHIWSYDMGVRQRNTFGGRVEIGQRLGFENSNSVYFLPQDQGTARLSLSYTQPLLRGNGRVYNTSLIVLAQIDSEISEQEFIRQLQAQLLEVTRAYWALYLERGSLLQKQRLNSRALEILEELKGRRGVDAVGNQIVRVSAAVAQRESDLYRAAAAVRNAEDRIQALVNDPEFAQIERLELIPAEAPKRDGISTDMQYAIQTAMELRPEISQSVKQIKAASVRLNMSKNELLPRLDAIVETYVSGLRGNSQIGTALTDQFSVGEPAYSVGLQFEVPLHNRAAKARLQRRRLELRQLQGQFRSSVETLLLEVKVAVREVDTAFREMTAKLRSMQAAEAQLVQLRERWRRLPGEDGSIGLYLEDVLGAQERLATAEFGYLQAQTTHALALTNLKRAMGTLLHDQGITSGLTFVDGLPTTTLDKPVTETATPQTFHPRITEE